MAPHWIKLLLSFLTLWGLAIAQNNDLDQAIGMMNQARQSRGLRPLLWSNDLTNSAGWWATQMATGAAPFAHAPPQYRQKQGETLYERSLWNGQPISDGREQWLHWSQIMWASTTHIGCARAFGIGQPYKVFDVCRFYPEGNILGQKPF
ncbi:hypothetical protein V2G26_014139 [Clonostachys chloroleuca]